MKTKPDTNTTSVAVTSTAKLVIQGQTFEMTLDELKALHEKIGAVIGAKTEPDFEKLRKLMERGDQAKPQRPWYPPPHYWDQPQRRIPLHMQEVTCAQRDEFRLGLSGIGPDTAKAMLP